MRQIPRILQHQEYRPDIDGLRAIAVLSVIAYHAFPEFFPGGFTGVDVFFVISGYLISTIIFSSLERENFNYLEFFSRRIKRIFPALIIVLVSCLVFGWYILYPNEYSQLGKHTSAGAGFLSNFALWSEVGYFDSSARVKPLLHLWSLGIEEQFYILWPVLLGFAWKNKISLLLMTVFVAILSFSINIYFVNSYPAASFFFPVSRFWELMAGGILAYIVLHKPGYLPGNRFITALLSLFGLGLIVFSVAFVGRSYVAYPGWWSLLPVGGTILVIASSKSAWLNRKLLSHSWIVWVGIISYPLYLWHWPLLSFNYILENGDPSDINRIILILASVLLAWLTYELIEKRFKKGYSTKSIYFLSVSMVLLLIIGLFLWKGIILPRQNSKAIEEIEIAAGDWNYPGELDPVSVGEAVFYSKGSSKRKTFFFGDSHMEQYAPRIVKALKDRPESNTAVFATSGGCRPVPEITRYQGEKCQIILDAAMAYMNSIDVDIIVIGAAWNNFLIEKNPRKSIPVASDSSSIKNQENRVASEMKKLESFLSRLAENKKVYLLLDNPGGGDFSPYSLLQGTRFNLTNMDMPSRLRKYASYPREQKILRDELREIAARSGATILDPARYLCPDNQNCKVLAENGTPIYKDGWHLRPLFVEQYVDFIDVTLSD